MPQPLNPKERNLFTQVVKNFENKQYKKGLKAADQILRKVPNHGDTLAMKALIINSQGHTDDAFSLAKEALKVDMKSHVCWHVYGLLYRAVKSYEEAIKAYKFALRLEPESQQIQRDLALLQIQMRDFEGFIQSRRAMLQSRPALRMNWTALAIAQHLAGDLEDAERTLTTYEETLKTTPPKTDQEHSECILYKNQIIAEMGQIERALEHLEAAPKNNFDRTTVAEVRAKYLLQLGKMEDAAKAYRALIDRNSDNRLYFDSLRKATSLDDKDPEAVKAFFDEFAKKFPKGDAPRRLPLELLEGDHFKAAADPYLQRLLQKGIPSLFANIKALYADAAKKDIVQELAESYAADTHTPIANGSADKKTNGHASSFESYTYYFLAQHYNYHLSRDLTKAIHYIDKALEVSPESLDFHMTKARILKHYGDLEKASEIMNKARLLDERDRYINTRAAKYQLRNNENAKALETMSKFTRNEAAGGPLGDLLEMQCVWYLTEDGESYLRQERYGLALKRFVAIYNIFDIWQEDQFDLHGFSLRKSQTRAYIDMIRWEDHLREHPFYTRAAIDAIKTYIILHDRPQVMTNGVNGDHEVNNAERKKAAKKARKAQEKQEHIEAEKKDTKKTAGAPIPDPAKEDKDPEGAQLAATKEPLTDAMKFLTPLLESSPKDVRVQNIAFEVYLRRKKYLLALRCLLAARRLQPSSPQVYYNLIRLQHSVSTMSEPLPPKVAEIFESEAKILLPTQGADLTKLNNEFLASKKSTDPAYLRAYLQARQFLNPSSLEDNEKELVGLINASLEDAETGLELVKEWKGNVSRYAAAAHKRWPEATIFKEKTAVNGTA